jgi:hypothetical protein
MYIRVLLSIRADPSCSYVKVTIKKLGLISLFSYKLKVFFSRTSIINTEHKRDITRHSQTIIINIGEKNVNVTVSWSGVLSRYGDDQQNYSTVYCNHHAPRIDPSLLYVISFFKARHVKLTMLRLNRSSLRSGRDVGVKGCGTIGAPEAWPLEAMPVVSLS